MTEHKDSNLITLPLADMMHHASLTDSNRQFVKSCLELADKFYLAQCNADAKRALKAAIDRGDNYTAFSLLPIYAQDAYTEIQATRAIAEIVDEKEGSIGIALKIPSFLEISFNIKRRISRTVRFKE